MKLALLALLLPAGLALAHSFEPALLALRERAPGTFDVVWKSPVEGLVPRLPCRELAAGGDDGLALASLDCGAGGLAGRTIAVDGLADAATDVILRIETRNGRSTTGVLRKGADRLVVPGAAAGEARTAVLASYFRLGVAHILGGADHLLFVLALLLLVDGWWRLVETVRAFTVAHSLTLAAAVLGVAVPPAPPVEAAIALSIVLVAREIAAPSDTLARRRPWLVAFAFGLLHGLGFAGALVDAGLPPDHVPLALVGFNGGVEAGQLLFVALVLVPVRSLARLPGWARRVPAYAVGGVATAWTIARIEAFWRVPF